MSHSSFRSAFDLSRLLTPLILVALLLPAFLFLLQADALPCTHDNIFHSYRIVAMREMLRHGWVFSRWVPNLALGYGYPFFTYREPLPYLVGEGLFALGVPLPLVLGGLYAASLLAGAWGAYALARDLFGERAAWVSATAYGLAPYILMDAMRRGNMPESVGLALLPWLFVATRRLVLKKGRGRFIAVVLLLASLFLSHNISSLLLAPFLGLYVVALSWLHRDRGGWPYAFVAVGLAVLLTAWFWLPALTEQGFVQLNLSRSTRNNDFHYNFATWREMLFTAPAPYDPDFLNPSMRVTMGVGRTLLAMVGAAVGWLRFRDRESRWLIGLFMLAAVGYLWMATPGAVGLWESFPLMAFVQFPWRLVGRAVLPASLLAGLGVEALLDWVGAGRSSRRVGRAGSSLSWISTTAICICVAGLVLLSVPETYPPKGMCEAETYPGLASLYRLEQDGWMGMDPESSYFPIWVEAHPEDTGLAEVLKNGELPARFDLSVLPEGGEVVAAEYRSLAADLIVQSPEGFRARWLGLYYPGWRVWVDGEAVVVEPENDTGLMTFDLPAGEHEIRVRFGLTPMRRLGAGLAAVGVAATVIFMVLPGVLSPRDSEPGRAGAIAASGRVALAWSMLVLSVGLLVVRYGIVGRIATPVNRSRLAASRLPEVATALHQPYDGGLRLVGYTVSDDMVLSDGELPVSLLWLAAVQPSQNFRTSVLLRGPDGQIWTPAGTARPRGYEPPPPSSGWEPGQYVYDPHIVLTDPGTPPGVYDVVVALFDGKTLAPASPLDSDGRPLGTDLVIGTVQIQPPAQPPGLDALGVPMDAAPVECGPLALLDLRFDRDLGVPGDLLAVRWVWEAVEASPSNVMPVLVLAAGNGSVAGQWNLAAAADWWPTSRWAVGDRWVGRHIVRLPGDLDSGLYELRVLVPDCQESLQVEMLEIVAPERQWVVPAELDREDVAFASQVALAGYAVAPATVARGDRIDVTLAWQALVPMEVSYRVFLHLVDSDGVLIDQSDGEPARWSRPTTGWAPGEVVVEQRSVSVPADAVTGEYTLQVGIYIEDGARLSTGEGQDSYVIAAFPIE